MSAVQEEGGGQIFIELQWTGCVLAELEGLYQRRAVLSAIVDPRIIDRPFPMRAGRADLRQHPQTHLQHNHRKTRLAEMTSPSSVLDIIFFILSPLSFNPKVLFIVIGIIKCKKVGEG